MLYTPWGFDPNLQTFIPILPSTTLSATTPEENISEILTKKDITDCGWKLKVSTLERVYIEFTLKNRTLHFLKNSNCIIIDNDTRGVMYVSYFTGFIKNKSELVSLMKLISWK